VRPAFSITLREAAFSTIAREKISSRPHASNPKRIEARAASVA